MMEAVVEFAQIDNRHGSVQTLRGVRFSVGHGEVVAFLGPNGAGRTTAIAIMLGLRRPTSSRARLLIMDPGDPHARSQTGVGPTSRWRSAAVPRRSFPTSRLYPLMSRAGATSGRRCAPSPTSATRSS